MNTIDLVVLCLATLYLSIILSNEYINGPWNVLRKLREKAGVTTNQMNGMLEYRSGSLADMIMCPYCNSVWVGLVLTTFLLGVQAAGLQEAGWLLAPLAAGGFVVLIQEVKGSI